MQKNTALKENSLIKIDIWEDKQTDLFKTDNVFFGNKLYNNL
jgi:hypothetical protein